MQNSWQLSGFYANSQRFVLKSMDKNYNHYWLPLHCTWAPVSLLGTQHFSFSLWFCKIKESSCQCPDAFNAIGWVQKGADEYREAGARNDRAAEKKIKNR